MQRHLISLTLLLAAFLINTAQADPQQLTLKNDNINGVNIAWAATGNPQGAPLIIVAGMACSHKVSTGSLISGLTDAGYRVIVFDNRDVGASQRFYSDGLPSIWWNGLKAKIGLPVSARYDLHDMAQDVVALMDLLKIENAHIVGASMGGMIAQIVAAKHPQRTRSLISIMSTTSATHLPPPQNNDNAIRNNLSELSEQRRQQLNSRGFYPAAIAPHLLAMAATGDRSELVSSIAVDTLVIHGKDDKLLPLPHGEHTAELIANAQLVVFDGMAHNIPEPVMPKLIKNIQQHVDRVEQKARQTVSR